MEYWEAIDEVLDKAAEIKLPGRRLDVVTLARREFAKRSCCDSRLIDPIEEVLKASLQEWSLAKKRRIWQSTETGMQSDLDFGAYTLESIDMDLEGELMCYLIEELAPYDGKGDTHDDEF